MHTTNPAPALDLPDKDYLLWLLAEMAAKDDVLQRTVQALRTGHYLVPEGREECLGSERPGEDQLGLLLWLCRQCSTPLSVEVGFGTGSSAATILCARRAAGHIFQHVIFDPHGLNEGRGELVKAFLERVFPAELFIRKLASELGLGQLIHDRGKGAASLVFVDGGHHFENVMTDFVLADQLCCPGGYIVLDDAEFPAIETVINYVTSNRPDYAVANLSVDNTAVMRKVGMDQREWFAFKPFSVPNRSDWILRHM